MACLMRRIINAVLLSKVIQTPFPFEYPLSELRYRDMGTGQNVLLITVDGLNYSRFEKQMPALAGFAEQNISFTPI